ncbi:pitrilysin family protein [Jiulongibacter sediminis]|jgi:predicted Zn-dependent peptidase|uniref:M16 family metallopeptidase n=1 Tax=Jiulongibacter sediminis TaxID=1605367 RepID=UPI0026EA8A4A|nr:pitrilysin family protein [Jiulongibacter sediminis]
MPDRTLAPAFKPIKSIQLPAIKKIDLPNGVPLYLADFAQQDVLKLEIYFEAGHAYAAKTGLKSVFSKMLLEGTSQKSGSEIIEEFSQYGGFPEISQQVTKLNFTIYGLSKFIGQYMSLTKEILQNATFPEEQLTTQKKISAQGLQLNLEKTAYLAKRKMVQELFGANHPYGRSHEAEDIEAVNREDLCEFYQNRIKGKSFKIFASGKITDEEIKIISDTLGSLPVEETNEITVSFDQATPGKYLIPKPENMQSTLRIARYTAGRKDPDFFKMMVTNTTFGGFFGSRLMKNIREDKGYTYGISSSISPVKDKAYMTIGSDVVKQNTLDTLAEIEKEMKIMQDELISSDELELVKNYLAGSFAGSVTTAFEVMTRHKNIILNDLSADYYDTLIDKISEVEPFDIQQMAQKYFNPSEMIEVIVGEKI